VTSNQPREAQTIGRLDRLKRQPDGARGQRAGFG